MGERSGPGWRRIYRWPLNLVVLSLYGIAGLLAAVFVAGLVVLPGAVLGGVSVVLAVVIVALGMATVAVAAYRVGHSDRAPWWVRLSAPFVIGLAIWLGGITALRSASEFENAETTGDRLVTWTMLDSVPLLDLDRMLDYEAPIEDWSADVGLVLVLIRAAVLVLLVGLAAEIWRWGHGELQQHGAGTIVREGLARLVGVFDRPLTWTRWGIAVGAVIGTVGAIVMLAVLLGALGG